MSSYMHAEDVCEDLLVTIQTTCISKEDEDGGWFDYLEDYLALWWKDDRVFEVTGGDFALYSLAIALAVGKYLEDPSVISYCVGRLETRESPPRRVKGLRDPSARRHDYLDPEVYARRWHEYRYGDLVPYSY